MREGTIKAQINKRYWYRCGKYLFWCEIVDIKNGKFKIKDIAKDRILPRWRKVGELFKEGTDQYYIVRIK